jgi:hypothetical protein
LSKTHFWNTLTISSFLIAVAGLFSKNIESIYFQASIWFLFFSMIWIVILYRLAINIKGIEIECNNSVLEACKEKYEKTEDFPNKNRDIKNDFNLKTICMQKFTNIVSWITDWLFLLWVVFFILSIFYT